MSDRVKTAAEEGIGMNRSTKGREWWTSTTERWGGRRRYLVEAAADIDGAGLDDVVDRLRDGVREVWVCKLHRKRRAFQDKSEKEGKREKQMAR